MQAELKETAQNLSQMLSQGKKRALDEVDQDDEDDQENYDEKDDQDDDQGQED